MLAVVSTEDRNRLGRDFWFYFSGQAVSQLGSSFTIFALPLLVFKLTHSATNLALTTAAEAVPYLLFGLLLGAVVDRFDRKRLMLASDIAQALVIAVIPVLAIAGVLRVADIYAVTFVQATLGIIFNCGEFAAIPSLVGERELVTANARIMATNNAGQILGPGLAGALVAFIPVADLLFVDAGSFFVSSACLALVRRSFNAAASATPAGRPAGSAIRSLLADVREGLAYVWSNPLLRSISIMMALINFVAAFLLRRHRPRRPGRLRAGHDRHGPRGFLPGRTGAVGGRVGLWPAVQHQHRRPAPGDRAASALRAGGQRRPGPGLVGHPPRIARRGGRHQPERERHRRLRRHRRPYRRHRPRLRLQPRGPRGPLPRRGSRDASKDLIDIALTASLLHELPVPWPGGSQR